MSKTETVGLTSEEASVNLSKFGPNKLPEKPPPSDLKIFFSQLKSPLVYILLVASLITVALGDYTDAMIISIAVFINTILGFFQERRANHALEALKNMLHPKARVIRDGKKLQIGLTDVVPGDVCVLSAGDKIPADGKLLEANRLFITEAILTGESMSVAKNQDDEVFMGTIVSAGKGTFVAMETGASTKMGKIAESIQIPQDDTPLRNQLTYFSKQLTTLVVILTFIVFTVGLIRGRELVEIFTTSVALAVSSIPEGLLVGLTVVLALGMQKILKNKGLVRNLVSAETLGGVTTICVDKTGTLTQGKMQVANIVGSENEIAKQMIIANDLDDPIVIASYEWASKVLTNTDLKGENIGNYIEKHSQLDSIPFSSSERFFASLNKVGPNEKVIFVNGAPEYLLEWSTLSVGEKQNVKKDIEKLTGEGKRLIGLAKKLTSNEKKVIDKNDVRMGLEWVGLIALSDPVRNGVKDALEKTTSAGLSLIVITGDFTQTAVSVLSQLGIEVNEKSIILGSELEKMANSGLRARLADVNGVQLFSRTTPDQKLKIVEALKANGEVVAMMGDGVNDAPALKKADIGIVVGEATDVAKESADLILLDSSFATIVMAIEEGRSIFDNIRKIILYLMTDAFSEIVAVLGSIILGLPLAVTAAQILWINLVSDGLPHLALTVDPPTHKLMTYLPRNPKEKLVTSWMKNLILIISLVGGLIGLGLFVYFYKTTGNVILAQTVTFVALGINSLIYVFSIRTLANPVWQEKPFVNKWLNLAVFAGFILQVIPFLFVSGRDFLGLVVLTPSTWLVVLGSAVIMFIIIEVLKVPFRHKLHHTNV